VNFKRAYARGCSSYRGGGGGGGGGGEKGRKGGSNAKRIGSAGEHFKVTAGTISAARFKLGFTIPRAQESGLDDATRAVLIGAFIIHARITKFPLGGEEPAGRVIIKR